MLKTLHDADRTGCPQPLANGVHDTTTERRGEESAPCRPSPSAVHASQLARLNALLEHTWTNNPFYRNKWQQTGVDAGSLDSIADVQRYPFTTRAELVADQAARPPLGTNSSCPLKDFRWFLHSSGTTRSPILWADTPRTWKWVAHCSAALHALTGITQQDVVLFLANFGTTSGPSVIREGVRRIGCTCLTCNSHDVTEACRWLSLMRPNVLIGKPEPLMMFALALRSRGLIPALAGIKRLILTGEGSSIDSPTRRELERHWDAPCFDRYGMTEAGSVAAECVAHDGTLHILDDEFVAEVIHPASNEPLDDGDAGELVLTNLGRIDRPIIRYRTGDRVRLLRESRCTCGRTGMSLSRGILGRMR
jgi:phenylacetate-CoA ligase